MVSFMKFSLDYFSPEKALVERALELRAELENAVSDVHNLFAKIGLHLYFEPVTYSNIMAKDPIITKVSLNL